MAPRTHRTQMPYSFRVVNATYVNAYAFPGGSIACTRGILLKLDDEAELAALLGHEIGHVNARHTAAAMSKGMVCQAFWSAGSRSLPTSAAPGLGQITSALGGIGAGALLACYSRDNERQADALGTEYMVRAGYGPERHGRPDGDAATASHKSKPSGIEIFFATHPMSDERYQTAVTCRAHQVSRRPRASRLPRAVHGQHRTACGPCKGTIDEMQKGQSLAAGEKLQRRPNTITATPCGRAPTTMPAW